MVWGLVISSIFIPLTIKANSSLVFVLFLLLGMLGNALFHPQVSALIKKFNEDNPNLSRAMGIFLGMGTIGYAIGPYMSSSIVNSFGEEFFPYVALFGILASILIYFLVHHLKLDKYF